jgi:carboxyl-terminal processing protease
MRCDLLARTFLAIALALSIGCKSPGSVEAHKAGPLATPATPPPLAVETFQAVWEIVRDTHFDTNFNAVDWNAARTNFLPRVQTARSQEELRDTIQDMLDLLNVSHLMVLPGTPQRRFLDPETNKPPTKPAPNKSPSPPIQPAPPAEAGSLGIEVRVLNNQLVVFRVDPASTSAKEGVQAGWVIEQIDGEAAIDPDVDETEKNREFLLWHRAASLLKGPFGEKCTLAVVTNTGQKKMIAITRGRESGQPAKLGNLPTMYTRVTTNQLMTSGRKRVGYLAFNLWMIPAVQAINEFVDANRNSAAIIVDLRGNLGGIGGMVMGVAGHFVNERVSLGRMTMRDNNLNFLAIPRRVDTQLRGTNTFRGKLAILVDGVSLSSAELFAGGMQELGRGRVFGERTGGQALPAVSDRLPNGDLLYHAVADFKTPKGRRLEENGVVPDEIVPLRLEALRAGIDEPLQAALRWIDSTPQRGGSGVE